ncbi:substrate-binding domain-containing protein [Geotalea sp. SG265]|uniref:substrate-binding domain-containing protein n=1 Tax=Geotalea sp. SG265 TaxID=2922867 RepID=UPI001FB00ECF|nr:substrate-binding domain-containing protein [Geotalea sp. SG265]
MKRYFRAALVPILLYAGGCAAPATLKVGGDDTTISGFLLPVKETFEEETKVPLAIIQIKPGEELALLNEAKVDAVMATGSLKDLLHDAAQKGVVVPTASLHQVAVGKNSTVIFLHKGNRIKQLNQKQLRSIFTGKTRNWHQLGGPDREIVVVWDGTSAAENEAFIKGILKDAPIAAKFRSVGSFEEVRKVVMETPGAIGIAPSGFIAPGVKVPKTPKVSSPVILVTKGNPSPLTDKLIGILKDAAYIQ